MRKKIMALSLLGIPFLMPSCSEKEENFNEFQTTETNQIEENGVTAKDIYYEEVHIRLTYQNSDGTVMIVELDVWYYEDTDTGLRIFIVRQGFINGKKANVKIYNPNEDGNPHSGKYTVVNVDENEVLGMYTLEELMGNVVNE